jgi:hypothetical protein
LEVAGYEGEFFLGGLSEGGHGFCGVGAAMARGLGGTACLVLFFY